MYDLMLNYKASIPVLRDENVYLFIRSNKTQWMSSAVLHGKKIQDFRYPRLGRRVKEERGWLKEIKAELKEIRGERVVNPSKRSKGYVMLPLNRSYNQHLYPRRSNNHIWRSSWESDQSSSDG